MLHNQDEITNKKHLVPLVYKILAVFFVIGNWIACFSLLVLDYHTFQTITFIILIYMNMGFFLYLYRTLVGAKKTLKIIHEEKKRVSMKIPSLPHLSTYAFVIPSYKEELSVLRRTLSELVSHECSHQYLVVLAMEQNEVDSDKKAEILIREYSASFRGIEFTRHIPQPGEAQGKTANVNWAAMRLEPIFAKYGIDPSHVELTIMDADSLIPDIYIRQLEKKFKQGKSRHDFIFGPSQVYSINREESQVFGRIHDTLYTQMHFTTFHSFFKASTPISNYSISYQTLKEIGFNDNHKDTIAEDTHIILKTINKTKGRVQSEPIYVFSNQMSLYGGKGIYEEFMAKFWQQERHQRAVLELGYAMNAMIEDKFQTKAIMGAFASVFMITFDQMVALWYTSLVMHKIFSGLFSAISVSSTIQSSLAQQISLLSTIFSILGLVNLVIYFFVRFSFEVNVLKIKFGINKVIEIVETMVLFPIVVIIFANTTGIVAAIQLFNQNATYVTAVKKLNKSDD